MMKKKLIFALLIALAVIIAGAVLLPKLLPAGTEQMDAPAAEDAAEAPPAESVESEPKTVSDPVYGDGLTEEELEELKEEDASEDGSSLVIGEEFVIELGETQGTGGF